MESIYTEAEVIERVRARRAADAEAEAERVAQAAASAASRRERTAGRRESGSAATRRRSEIVRAYRARKSLATEGDAMHPLKRARIDAGLSQRDAAAKCGVPYRTYQSIEGGRPARAQAARRIRETFGVRVERAS